MKTKNKKKNNSKIKNKIHFFKRVIFLVQKKAITQAFNNNKYNNNK
jgi:hypothetical protein